MDTEGGSASFVIFQNRKDIACPRSAFTSYPYNGRQRSELCFLFWKIGNNFSHNHSAEAASRLTLRFFILGKEKLIPINSPRIRIVFP